MSNTSLVYLVFLADLSGGIKIVWGLVCFFTCNFFSLSYIHEYSDKIIS